MCSSLKTKANKWSRIEVIEERRKNLENTCLVDYVIDLEESLPFLGGEKRTFKTCIMTEKVSCFVFFCLVLIRKHVTRLEFSDRKLSPFNYLLGINQFVCFCDQLMCRHCDRVMWHFFGSNTRRFHQKLPSFDLLVNNTISSASVQLYYYRHYCRHQFYQEKGRKYINTLLDHKPHFVFFPAQNHDDHRLTVVLLSSWFVSDLPLPSWSWSLSELCPFPRKKPSIIPLILD